MIKYTSSFDYICEVIDTVDVVTFDIFDTLIGRATALEPEDLFYLLAKSSGLNDGEANSFKKLRISAESLARQESLRIKKTAEITIDDIYAKIGDVGVSKHDELVFERKHFYTRSTQWDLYKYAKSKGKKLYAISDIYYEKEVLEVILTEHGYEFDGVYSSCDYGFGKYNGFLFERFLQDVGIKPSLVLHIGDNIHSDVVQPVNYGMKSVHLPKAIDILFRDSSINLGAIESLHKSGSKFVRFILADLARKADKNSHMSMANVFAAMYAAPLLFCFVNYLEEEMKKDKVKKVYLMARDGYTTGSVIDAMSADIDYQIVNCSRRSVMLPAAALDKNYWRTFFASAKDISISEIVDGLSLDCADEIKALFLKQFGGKLLKDEHFEEFLVKSYEIALPQMKDELVAAKQYFEKIGLYDEGIALVDVGWSLNSHKAIEKITGKKIHGYYVGTSLGAYQNGLIKAFLFEHENSQAWSSIFRSAVELLELPFISLEQQTVRYQQASPTFREDSTLEVSRAIFAREMRDELLRVIAMATSMRLCENNVKSAVHGWLVNIYTCLACRPSLNERILIGMVPHDRHIAAVSYSTIGDFWSGGVAQIKSGISRKVLRSVRNEGVKATTLKVINHLYRRLR